MNLTSSPNDINCFYQINWKLLAKYKQILKYVTGKKTIYPEV